MPARRRPAGGQALPLHAATCAARSCRAARRVCERVVRKWAAEDQNVGGVDFNPTLGSRMLWGRDQEKVRTTLPGVGKPLSGETSLTAGYAGKPPVYMDLLLRDPPLPVLLNPREDVL